jgi:hypothetical protein
MSHTATEMRSRKGQGNRNLQTEITRFRISPGAPSRDRGESPSEYPPLYKSLHLIDLRYARSAAGSEKRHDAVHALQLAPHS